jgi:hypothetical protein
MKLQFTKVVKENWLTNLESGKYKQGFIDLYNSRNNTFCCIGVLGDCMEELNNDLDINLPDQNPYRFLRANIGAEATENLWKTNDKTKYHDDPEYPRDYSNVIPLIKALPTVD